ncbi:twin-arginine translocase TatA/TatE family subunit [Microbacterium ureisolvens]|uniref:twin-arginine translocase TatA/TatE family subunit n=1 Tax=Microbacterium ureisolvens TaxID=2781186 RepID=UPI003635F6FE
MLANINGMHLILLLVVVLLLFGAARLPALAKGVGQSVRILKTETKDAPAESGPAGSASRDEV